MSIPESTNQAYPYRPGEALPEPEGHISRGRFERVLRNGDFAVTAELAPPDSTDRNEVFEQAALFDGLLMPLMRLMGLERIAICRVLWCARYSVILVILLLCRFLVVIKIE